MEASVNVLQSVYLGNSIQAYLVGLGIFIAGVVVLVILEKLIIRRIRKFTEQTETNLDDLFFKAVEKTLIPLLYLGALYIAVNQLELTVGVVKLVSSLAVIFITVQITRLVLFIAVFFLDQAWQKTGETATGVRISKGIVTLLKLGVWSIAGVFILDNLGYNISAVVAGLGISGIAVALAAQTILGDLFNYFVILFDRPFKRGDFVIIDDFLGVIVHIGIKTTRIQSLWGEELVFSNTDLTSSRIKNYKKMEKRRVLFKLGVTYQTTSEQIKKIPQIIRGIIEKVEDTIFDRAHFQSYGDFSLDIESVYYVIGNDYNKYMDIQQQINFAIKEAFEKEGIEFAYPTRTLFINKEEQAKS